MLLKPCYLQASGHIGLADICLMACFALLGGQKLLHRQPLRFSKDRLLYGFLGMVVLLNLVCSVKLRDPEYLKYSLFWIYNGCAIWTWRTMTCRYGQAFLAGVNTAAKANIVVQLAVLASGRGRIYREYWGAVRYMGTFDDPNQMAFFLFMMLLLIYLYRCRYGDRSFWIFFVLAVPVLAASKSTGIWLGVLLLLVFCLARQIGSLKKSGRISRKQLGIIGAGLALTLAIGLYWIWPPADFDIHAVDYNLLTRIQEKIWKIMNGGLYGLVMDRGEERLFLYPRYLLIGAGEGGFARFEAAGPANELHSTWLSVWFCYGIVPMAALCVWLYRILKADTDRMWCAIGALLAESFFLINYRQPMFWMILLYGDVTESEPLRQTEVRVGTALRAAALRGKRALSILTDAK